MAVPVKSSLKPYKACRSRAEPLSLTKQISVENKLPSAKPNKLSNKHKNNILALNQNRQERSELPIKER